jgi:hypothetical protein
MHRRLDIAHALFQDLAVRVELMGIRNDAWENGVAKADRVSLSLMGSGVRVSAPCMPPAHARALAALLIECAEFAEGGAL